MIEGETIQYSIEEERQFWRESLSSQYIKEEIDILYFEILKEITLKSKMFLLVEREIILSNTDFSKINRSLEELRRGQPIQYLLGKAEFHGHTFKVNGHVLIPRPETEELVEWILQDLNLLQKDENLLSVSVNQPNSLRILDIGTGSGCIAISLALEFKVQNKEAEILGMDISTDALKIAQLNAVNLGASINWVQGDILQNDFNHPLPEELNIIVSNPPYVPFAEEKTLADRVKNFEPPIALFVPNNDPLVFYRSILLFAKRNLKPDGWLYFEIHENYALDLKSLGKSLGFYNSDLRNDMQGKPRMMRFKKPKTF